MFFKHGNPDQALSAMRDEGRVLKARSMQKPAVRLDLCCRSNWLMTVKMGMGRVEGEFSSCLERIIVLET